MKQKNMRRNHEELNEEFVVPDHTLGIEEEQLRAEAKKALQEALVGLTEKQAHCVELFFFEDLKQAEISQITDLPLNTVKSHVFRAKKMLRTKLEPYIKND